MTTVAVIPARGGSKRVPGKNTRLLAGKPLIAYTIEAALATPAIDRVIVSTDDDEIKDISEKFGAEVIHRPLKLSGDTASSESVIQHAVNTLERQGYPIDVIVFLQCTSPLRGADVIIKAIDKLLTTGADSVLSAYPDYRYLGGLNPSSKQYEPYKKDRLPMQKMKPSYCDNGAVYVFKRHVLETYDNRYGGDIRMVEMPWEDSFEIDSEFDFWLVEQIMIKRTEHAG